MINQTFIGIFLAICLLQFYTGAAQSPHDRIDDTEISSNFSTPSPEQVSAIMDSIKRTSMGGIATPDSDADSNEDEQESEQEDEEENDFDDDDDEDDDSDED